jgi:hypothetical protein
MGSPHSSDRPTALWMLDSGTGGRVIKLFEEPIVLQIN